MELVVKMYITPLESVIRLITPDNCYLCYKESDMLCLDCSEKTLAENESRCYKCNRLTSQSKLCSSCRSSSSLRRVWWLGNYQKTLKDLVRIMKFNHKRSYARSFGNLLASSLPYLPESTIVVPVPTASTRIRKRGFDQAVLIARSFAKSRNLQYAEIIVRNSQKDQIGQRRSQRFKQMEESFKLLNSKIKLIDGCSVILIDDVITTGATIEAAASLLRKYGAKHVDAAVVARHLLQ